MIFDIFVSLNKDIFKCLSEQITIYTVEQIIGVSGHITKLGSFELIEETFIVEGLLVASSDEILSQMELEF